MESSLESGRIPKILEHVLIIREAALHTSYWFFLNAIMNKTKRSEFKPIEMSTVTVSAFIGRCHVSQANYRR
jgi:hypothetical protein